MLSLEQLQLLRYALKHHVSILISGATGSGKTTLLNSLLNEIALLQPQERLIAIEDTPELKIQVANHLNLYTNATTDMSTLLRSALRLRPDRIIVGEVRGAEALDMIDALSTGHRGGLATIHAGSLEQAVERMTLLVSRHPHCPRLIEPTVASALELLLQVKRQGKQRRVTALGMLMGFYNQSFAISPVASMSDLQQLLTPDEYSPNT